MVSLLSRIDCKNAYLTNPEWDLHKLSLRIRLPFVPQRRPEHLGGEGSGKGEGRGRGEGRGKGGKGKE